MQSDQGFYAYAKAHREPLSCVWNTPSPVAKYAAGPCATGELAMQAALRNCDIDLRQRVSKANRLMLWLVRSVGGTRQR